MDYSQKTFKLSTKFFDNRKTQILLGMENGSTYIVIWLKLLSIAGQNDYHGSLYITDDVPYTPDELSSVLRVPVDEIEKALCLFKKYSMILISDDGVITIKNWDKYQNPEDSEYDEEESEEEPEDDEEAYTERKRHLASERKRRQRARERIDYEACHADVTPVSRECHADVTQESVTCHADVTQKDSLPPIPPISSQNIYINNNNNNISPSENNGEGDTEDRDKGCVGKGKKPKEEELIARFEIFWNAYGYKECRKDALRAFKKINPDDALLQKMLESIERYHRGRKWQEGYRKYGATWLNGECWNDEYDDGSEARSNAGFGRNSTADHGTARPVYNIRPHFAGKPDDEDT